MGLKWLHNDHTLYILPGLSLPPILLFKEKKSANISNLFACGEFACCSDRYVTATGFG